jgi:hypothetical protein
LRASINWTRRRLFTSRGVPTSGTPTAKPESESLRLWRTRRGETSERLCPIESGGKAYFVEVRVAKEVLTGWESHLRSRPSLDERVDRIIYYARFDA